MLKRKGYYRFDKDGVAFVRVDSCDEKLATMADKDVWAILDDDPIDEFGDHRSYDWLFLWTASPEKMKRSTWGKEARAQAHYLDTWTWPEIVATR